MADLEALKRDLVELRRRLAEAEATIAALFVAVASLEERGRWDRSSIAAFRN